MQAEINAPLQALLQTAEMVTPDQQNSTVAAKVAEAAQQKMQAAMPPGMRPGMPPSTPPGIGALLPGVQQQAMMAAQAAQPATQGDVNQIRQMMAQAQQAQQMQQGSRMGGGVAALPGADVRMAEGGVVGYSGQEGSEVELPVNERFKRLLRGLYERIETDYMRRAGATPEMIAQKLGKEPPVQPGPRPMSEAEIARMQEANAAPAAVANTAPPVARPPAVQQRPPAQAPVQQAPAAPMLPDTRESTAVNPSEAALQNAQLQGMVRELAERLRQKPEESEAEKAYRTAAMAEYQRGLGSIEAARQRMAASQQKQSQQDLINYLSGIGGSGSLFEGMRRSGQALSQAQQQREATRLAYEDKLEDRRNIVENLKLATLRQDAESARAWTNELRKNEVEIAKLNIGLGERRAGELATAERDRERQAATERENERNRRAERELRNLPTSEQQMADRVMRDWMSRNPGKTLSDAWDFYRGAGRGITERQDVNELKALIASLRDQADPMKNMDKASREQASALLRQAQAKLAQMSGLGGTTAPTGGATRPTSKAEFDALPKGARYINPADGKEYIKN